MKKFLLILLAFTSLPSLLPAQDISLNIISELNGVPNGVWPLSPLPTTSGIRVTVCNNDGGVRNVPAFKLKPLISVPLAGSFVQIAPNAQQINLPAGWSIVSNTGSSIQLCNGTDTWPPGECRDFLIYVTPVAAGGPAIVAASLFWGNNGTCFQSGPQTPGNNPNNDNSQTSVTVVPGSPLPINLISFKGSVNNCKSTLSWKVSDDSNSDEFEVEQSTDGKTFAKISNVKAVFNRTGYESVTGHPGGKVFYRLRMKDLESIVTYSNIITLTSSCNGSSDQFRVYPNPVITDRFSIEFGNGGSYKVQLVSSSGMVLQNENMIVSTGQVKQLRISNYAKGAYLVRITNNTTGITKSEKLILQ